MKKITIETPIALLKVKGNFKEKASEIPTTAISTYEEKLNQTFIVVNVPNEEGIDLKVSEDYKKELDLNENDFISRLFSK